MDQFPFQLYVNSLLHKRTTESTLFSILLKKRPEKYSIRVLILVNEWREVDRDNNNPQHVLTLLLSENLETIALDVFIIAIYCRH